MKKCIFFLLIFLFPLNAYAKEVIDVCATYENTGKSYAVEAQIYKGPELNRATSSFDYNTFSTYAVIFWSSDQVSVIELDYYFGFIGFSPIKGTDQRGYPWEIEKGNLVCF
jgi:hypothetical protein